MQAMARAAMVFFVVKDNTIARIAGMIEMIPMLVSSSIDLSP